MLKEGPGGQRSKSGAHTFDLSDSVGEPAGGVRVPLAGFRIPFVLISGRLRVDMII